MCLEQSKNRLVINACTLHKLDANEAQQNGKLSPWLETLVEITIVINPELTEFDIESIKGEKVQNFQKEFCQII